MTEETKEKVSEELEEVDRLSNELSLYPNSEAAAKALIVVAAKILALQQGD